MKSFKKIASSIAAALAISVLSALPTKAAVISPSLTIDTSTSSITTSETATAVVTLSFISETSADTATILSATYSQPSGASKSATLTLVETNTATVAVAANKLSADVNSTINTAGYVTAKFRLTLDSVTVAGTYVINVLTTRPNPGSSVAWTVNVRQADVTPSAATTTSIINRGETVSATADESVFAPKTVSSDAAAVIVVNTKNAAGGAATESLLATVTGAGSVGYGTNATTMSMLGRSIVVPNGNYIGVFSDGTAGVGTITLTTLTGTVIATEKVTFYGDAASIVLTPIKSVISVGSNTNVVKAVALDASGVTVGAGTLYVYSNDVATISDSGTAVSIADGAATFALTGVKTGSANVVVKNATGAIASNAVSIRVEGVATKVKVSFDKTSYAPGEAAVITVQVVDSTDLPVAGKTFSNLFAAGGITSTYAFGTGSDVLTSVSVTTDTNTVKTYKVFMPMAAGNVEIKATGGSSLPTAGQVPVMASTIVVDKSAEALAAVTALSAQIAIFIEKITVQLKTLSDLILKIQKKVKA